MAAELHTTYSKMEHVEQSVSIVRHLFWNKRHESEAAVSENHKALANFSNSVPVGRG